MNQPSVHSDTRLARKLENGHYLVCHEHDGAVREYDHDGKVVWEYEVPLFGQKPAGGHGPEAFGNQCFCALRLQSGNTLIATGNGHSLLEVTPDKQIVWSVRQNDLPGITARVGDHPPAPAQRPHRLRQLPRDRKEPPDHRDHEGQAGRLDLQGLRAVRGCPIQLARDRRAAGKVGSATTHATKPGRGYVSRFTFRGSRSDVIHLLLEVPRLVDVFDELLERHLVEHVIGRLGEALIEEMHRDLPRRAVLAEAPSLSVSRPSSRRMMSPTRISRGARASR